MKIKDIARETHLSISTVSKALNNAHDVSDETKKIVQEYAQKYGYKSKEQRMLQRHKRRICILYCNMGPVGNTNVLYPLADSFTEVASENNTEVVLYNISEQTSFLFNSYMKEGHFDGAFIVGLNYSNPVYEQLKYTEYPVVLFDNQIIHDKIASVGTDNIHSVVNAFDYLYELGHRKIAFVNGEKYSFASNERFAGYIIGLMNHDLNYHPELVHWGDFSKQAGKTAVQHLKDKNFTAIICASDLLAVGVIEGFQELGLNIPNDISIIGFDDFEIAANLNPSITTIKQDFQKIGRSAYILLINLIFNRSAQRLIFRGELITRKSTKKID